MITLITESPKEKFKYRFHSFKYFFYSNVFVIGSVLGIVFCHEEEKSHTVNGF